MWATHIREYQRLVEIDPATGGVSRIRLGGYPMAVATGHGALWVFVDTASSPIIERRDLETGGVSSEVLPIGIVTPVCTGYGRNAPPGELCVAIGVGDHSVWAATPEELTSELWPLDPGTGDLRGDPSTLPCCVMAIAPGRRVRVHDLDRVIDREADHRHGGLPCSLRSASPSVAS